MADTARDNEESKIAQKFKQAWARGEGKDVSSIIGSNPELLKRFRLTEVKTKAPRAQRDPSDRTYGVIGTLIITPILLVTYSWLNTLLGQENLIYTTIILAALLTLCAIGYTSIISEKPFRHRAPHVSTYPTLLASMTLTTIVVTWNYFNSLQSNNWLSLDTVGAVVTGLIGGAFLGVIPAILAVTLTRRIVGVPITSHPHYICLKSNETLDKAVPTLLNTLGQLGFNRSRLLNKDSSDKHLFATFTPTTPIVEACHLAVQCYSNEDKKTIIKMLAYKDTGNSIDVDDGVKSKVSTIIDLLKTRLAVEPHSDTEHGELFEFGLSNTRSKLHFWLVKHVRPLIKSTRKQAKFIVFAVAIGALATLSWPNIVHLLSPAYRWLSSQSPAIGAIATVLAFVIREIYPRIKQKIRRESNNNLI